jgi:cytoskeleton protein RodZ
MASVGTELKRLREERQLSIKRAAEETRISARHLQSLEEGRYGDLPGGMYNRAFLRAYSEYLGADPKEFIQGYERETGNVPERPPKPAVTPQYTAPKPHPLTLWVIGILATAAGLYLSRGSISEVLLPYFASPSPVRTASRPGANRTIPIAIEPIRHHQDAAPVTQGASATVSDEDSAPMDSSSGGEDPQGKITLNVEVVDDCWVSLSSDGNRVLVRLLKPGEDHTYAANEGFYLVLGNAGGVHLKLNGVPLKPLGRPGDVVKLQITEQNLKELLEKSTS